MIRMFLITALSLAICPMAQAAKVKLGAINLMDAKDRDVVTLQPCRSSNNVAVTKLQLVVTKYQAEIDRLKVVYHNGQEQVLQVRDTFKPGTTSRWIDLSGEARCIQKIVVIGDSDTRGIRPGKQAHVAFWGQSNSESSTAPGHTVLGKVRLGDAKDRDVVNLAPCKTSSNTPVRKLKVVAKKYQAEIDKLKVVFQNGQQQILTVRDTFRPGTDSRWIDLSGEARCIDKIIVIGDTNSFGWRPGKQAELVFHGK
jgi:hypothetical protein